MNRRRILKIAGATVVIAGGALAWRAFDQGVFSAGSGAAYEPWENWQADDSLRPLRLVRAAILAANPHNSQPWRFRVADNAIDVFADAEAIVADRQQSADSARTIYVAGQTAWSVAHRGTDHPSLQAQTVECFDNVKRCLETAGASFDDVLKLTIFVVGLNRAGRDVIAEVRARYVNPAHPPAATMVGVERLVLEGQLIEVEAIAVVD